MPTFSQVAFWVITLLCAGGGAYFGSYLKKKGENLATHEDFDRLLAEVETTTKTTKSIEEKISDMFWNKQRRWELKRDVLLDAARKMGALQFSMQDMEQVAATFARENKTPNWQEQADVYRAFRGAQVNYRECFLLVSLNCATAAISAFMNYGKAIENIVDLTRLGKPVATEIRNTMAAFALEVVKAIRRELGVGEWDTDLTSRSNESSAAPSPDS
jgi:hypothetical protein